MNFEQCHVIFLDANRRFISHEVLAVGGTSAVLSSFRSLFERTVSLGAHNLIIAHNHPSGDATPSEEDVRSTAQLVKIANALAVNIVDHVIVAGTKICSMRGAGLL
jgi:DNA repair protein RadC